MRVLLTGVSGFIGRVAALRLRSYGHEVVGLVHSSAAPPSVTQVVRATLGSEDAAESVTASCDPCEAIVHAAACIRYENLNRDLIRVNCLGTQQLLEIAHGWNVTNFINISSIGVLGQPREHPITEGHPTAPQTTYHATKLFGEHLVASLAIGPDMARSSLRVTAPVGPGMPEERLLRVLVKNALDDRPLLLYGHGTRRQNYVDVRDVADAIVGCLEQQPTGVFNIGGVTAVSNLQLAEKCIQVLGSKSSIQFVEGTPDPADDEDWDVSSKSASVAFKYRPCHDIDSSINAVARDFESSHE